MNRSVVLVFAGLPPIKKKRSVWSINSPNVAHILLCERLGEFGSKGLVVNILMSNSDQRQTSPFNL